MQSSWKNKYKYHQVYLFIYSASLLFSEQKLFSKTIGILSPNFSRTHRSKYLLISFQNEGHPHRRNRLHRQRSPPPSPPSPLHNHPHRPLPPRPIPPHHPPQTPSHNPRRFRHLPSGSPHPARRRRSVHLVCTTPPLQNPLFTYSNTPPGPSASKPPPSLTNASSP